MLLLPIQGCAVDEMVGTACGSSSLLDEVACTFVQSGVTLDPPFNGIAVATLVDAEQLETLQMRSCGLQLKYADVARTVTALHMGFRWARSRLPLCATLLRHLQRCSLKAESVLAFSLDVLRADAMAENCRADDAEKLQHLAAVVKCLKEGHVAARCCDAVELPVSCDVPTRCAQCTVQYD